MMIKTILTHIDFLSNQIEMLNLEITDRFTFYREDIELVRFHTGIATLMAEQILAEIGTDVENQFSCATHLCSWAGLVPGHNESTSKRKSATMKKAINILNLL